VKSHRYYEYSGTLSLTQIKPTGREIKGQHRNVPSLVMAQRYKVKLYYYAMQAPRGEEV
jgi:hypothetical protein